MIKKILLGILKTRETSEKKYFKLKSKKIDENKIILVDNIKKNQNLIKKIIKKTKPSIIFTFGVSIIPNPLS